MKRATGGDYDRPTTIINTDTTLETSKLVSGSSVQIAGNFIGNIEVAASLTVTESGKVYGNIKAQYLLMAGEVNGNIEVAHQIHLTNTGKVSGDILCGSIIVDEGAIMEGKCTMKGIAPTT